MSSRRVAMQNRVVSHEDWLKGEMFHTCSCHGRGIDIVNGAYHFLQGNRVKKFVTNV
jgi:hypothetical protein